MRWCQHYFSHLPVERNSVLIFFISNSTTKSESQCFYFQCCLFVIFVSCRHHKYVVSALMEIDEAHIKAVDDGNLNSDSKAGDQNSGVDSENA